MHTTHIYITYICALVLFPLTSAIDIFLSVGQTSSKVFVLDFVELHGRLNMYCIGNTTLRWLHCEKGKVTWVEQPNFQRAFRQSRNRSGGRKTISMIRQSEIGSNLTYMFRTFKKTALILATQSPKAPHCIARSCAWANSSCLPHKSSSVCETFFETPAWGLVSNCAQVVAPIFPKNLTKIWRDWNLERDNPLGANERAVGKTETGQHSQGPASSYIYIF